MRFPHRSLFTGLLALGALLVSAERLRAEITDGPVYELRIYTCEPGKLEALNKRFRNHTLQIFTRHGIENVAYWLPTEEPASKTTLYYLLRHKSREAAKKSWSDFRNDPEWKQLAADWKKEYGKLLTKAPEVTYMVPTDYSPTE